MLQLTSQSLYHGPTMQIPSLNEYNMTCHPIICDRVKEYEVEHILDSCVFQGKLEYLVHWKGYSIEEDEWRPSEDVKATKRLVTDLHQRNPEAPQHILALNFSKLPFCPLTNFMDTLDSPVGMGYWWMHIGIATTFTNPITFSIWHHCLENSVNQATLLLHPITLPL